MFYDSLEGWEWVRDGSEVQEGGDINMLSRLVIAFLPMVSQGFFSIVTPAPHKHYYLHRVLMFTVVSLTHCDVGGE